MKKNIAVMLLVMFTFVFGKAQTPAAKATALTFEKTTLDYGTVKHNSEPLRTFKFKNTSGKPVIITNATGSCGCTVPEWPKQPIGPGESSKIDVRYDTNRPGPFTKTVTVTTNDGESLVLTITGTVQPAAQ
jgi:hypothetical protein